MKPINHLFILKKIIKKTFTIIFFIFFSSSINADDISQFQIEGISIDSSALDYFSEEEILRNKQNFYNDDGYSVSEFLNKSKFKTFSTYDAIQIHYKKNDQNYIIEGISGIIDLLNNINDCKMIKKEIDNEISSILKNIQKDEFESSHSADPTGNSRLDSIVYTHQNGTMNLRCVDWAEETNYIDHLRFSINSNELNDWLNKFAYK